MHPSPTSSCTNLKSECIYSTSNFFNGGGSPRDCGQGGRRATQARLHQPVPLSSCLRASDLPGRQWGFCALVPGLGEAEQRWNWPASWAREPLTSCGCCAPGATGQGLEVSEGTNWASHFMKRSGFLTSISRRS